MVRQRPTIRLNHGFDRWVHDLAKVGVEGSNPFARSKIFNGLALRALAGLRA
jgi:hypothetical protein